MSNRFTQLAPATVLVCIATISVGHAADAKTPAAEETAPAPLDETAAREYFRAAGSWYRIHRPMRLSSGAYRCLAEEFREFETVKSTGDWMADNHGPVPLNLPYFDPQGTELPTVTQAISLLEDESPDVRLAAAIWLFEENRLWWIGQLDEPLREKIEGKLIAGYCTQLHDEEQSVRHEAAASLARLRTPTALALLIEKLEDPEYGHADDIVSGVREGLSWRIVWGIGPCFRHRFGPGQCRVTSWSMLTLLSLLKVLAGDAAAKIAMAEPTPCDVIADEFPKSNWGKLNKDEQDRRFRSWLWDLRSVAQPRRCQAVESLALVDDGRAIEPLTFALRDSDATVREMAARSLAKLKDRRAVEPLILALQDNAAMVRAVAVDALRRIGDDRALRAVRVLRYDAEPQVRQAVVNALARLGEEVAVDSAIDALDDKNSGVRQSAVATLRHSNNARATEALIGVARYDVDTQVRWAAVEILARRKDARVYPDLVATMKDGSMHIRCLALKSLAELADPRTLQPLLATAASATPESYSAHLQIFALFAISKLKKDDVCQPLLDALDGEDHAARLGAALALGCFKDPRAVAPLLTALDREDPILRQNAIWSLMRLGDRRAVKPLIEELGREFSWSRIDAAIALGRLGDDRAVGPLCELLGGDDPWLQKAAAISLGTLGNRSAVEPLVATLDDEDRQVALAAAESLALLGDERPPFGYPAFFAKLPIPPGEVPPGSDHPLTAGVPALFAWGWEPKSFEDCVHLLVLCDRPEVLASLNPEVTPVLVDYLKSQDAQLRSLAAEILIRIGDEKTLPALTEMILQHGTRRLAILYNSCGRHELSKAAQKWTGNVSVGRRSPSIRWGGRPKM